ncbi:MAG: hypothetical protein ACLUNZ_06100 [Evtepia sp.]
MERDTDGAGQRPGRGPVVPAERPDGQGHCGRVCHHGPGPGHWRRRNAPQPATYAISFTPPPSLDAYTQHQLHAPDGAGALAIVAALPTFRLRPVSCCPVQLLPPLRATRSIPWARRSGGAWPASKGFRGAFFGFRLSYFLWFAVSQFTYGVLDLYVQPYTSIGGMIFISEAARFKQGQKPQEP